MLRKYKKEFIQLWNEGKTIREISLVIPYSQNAIYNYSLKLRKNGEIKERKRGRKPYDVCFDDYKEQFIKYWNLGYTYKQIATVLPLTRDMVYDYSKILKESGEIEHHKRGAKPNGIKQMVQTAWLMGEHDKKKLAERFGLAISTVNSYLVGLGLQKTPSEKSVLIAQEIARLPDRRGKLSEIARAYGVTHEYCRLIRDNLERYINVSE